MSEERLERGILLRSGEVARILNISLNEVISLANKGELKSTKQGNFYRFRLRDVAVYRSKHEKATT